MTLLKNIRRSIVCFLIGHDWDPASGTVKLGVLNFEFVSKRWLKLVQVKPC